VRILGDAVNLQGCIKPKSILMSDPKFYTVSYAINIHMVDENGDLNQVNPIKALQEWLSLKRCFEKLGYPVDSISSVPGLPDLVFSANQSLPLPDGRVVLSKMRSSERDPEVEVFKSWFETKGISDFIKMDSYFESMGDVLWHPGKLLLWGGFGFRTVEPALDELFKKTKIPIITLKLINEKFYHLDTCFSLLDEKTLAYFPGAFDQETNDFLEKWFERTIILDEIEAVEYFAGNCYCPDGKNVILHPGSEKFEKELFKLGFKIHHVDTSEFIKGGGSVFCMKLPLFF
jgi:N-dimethylarginine dimethylaminohydrolase